MKDKYKIDRCKYSRGTIKIISYLRPCSNKQVIRVIIIQRTDYYDRLYCI